MIKNKLKDVKLTYNSKSITYYIWVLLGLMMFSLYIYIFFIRKRLPKDIPFTLTEYGFFILLYICSFYIFLTKQAIYPKPININLLHLLKEYIKRPFIYFDSFIKYNKFIYPQYTKLFFYSASKFDNWNKVDHILVTYIFYLSPRILLVMIFAVDVFIVGNISIFYIFIPLGLIPFIYRYFRYSISFAFEQYIKNLEEDYDKVWILEEDYDDPNWEHNEKAIYHDRTVSIKEYIKVQYEVILNYNDKDSNFDYIGRPIAKEKIYLEYRKNHKLNATDKLSFENYDQIHRNFNIIMPEILKLNYFIECSKIINENNYIPTIKGLIFGMYLICWIYIIIISFTTLKDFNILLRFLEVINKYYAIEEPFTGFHNHNIDIHININFILYCLMLLMKMLYKFKILLLMLIFIYKRDIFPQNETITKDVKNQYESKYKNYINKH